MPEWILVILFLSLFLGVPLVALILSIRANHRLSRIEKLLSTFTSEALKKDRPSPVVDPEVEGKADLPDNLGPDRISCPLCRKSIKREATKCLHCRAFLNPEETSKSEEPVGSSPPAPLDQSISVVSSSPDNPKEAEAGTFERVVGERILSGVGILILVVGLSLLLWYSFTKLGAVGKVSLAGGTGVGMIILGTFLLSRVRYLVPGGCLVAGGWAVTYATGYASYQVEAARLISSPTVGFFLVLGIGTGAILHSLRFRKEWVAAMAYGLLFLTFFIFKVENTGKFALIPIALSFVLLIWKLRWIQLGGMGLAVLYVLTGLSSGGSLSQTGVFLLFLWVVMFSVGYLFQEKNRKEETLSAIFSLINMVGFVVCGLRYLDLAGLEKYWWLFASCGIVYAIQAEWSLRRKSRGTYGVCLTGSVVLLCWTGWKLLPLPYISLSWMVLAVVLLYFGMSRKTLLPRVLGHALLLFSLLKVWGYDTNLEKTVSLLDWEIPFRSLPALTGALLVYLHAAVSSRIAGAGHWEKNTAPFFFPWLGSFFLACGLIAFSPSLVTATLLSLCAFVLVEGGRKYSSPHLQIQGVLFCLCAFGMAGGVNLHSEASFYGISERLVSIGPALFFWIYTCYRLSLTPWYFSAILSAGCLSGVLSLSHFELGASSAPMVWGLIAGIWILAGISVPSRKTVLEGTIASLATAVHYGAVSSAVVPFVGLGGAAAVGVPISLWFLGLHAWVRKKLSVSEEAHSLLDNLIRIGMTLSLASILFLVLARSVEGTWLTGSWALLSVGLALYGFFLRDRMCRWSSLLVLGICITKLFFFDFGSFVMPVKIATTIGVGGCMLAVSIVYARNRDLLTDYFTKE